MNSQRRWDARLFVKRRGLEFLKMLFFLLFEAGGRWEGVGRKEGGASGETQGNTKLDGIHCCQYRPVGGWCKLFALMAGAATDGRSVLVSHLIRAKYIYIYIMVLERVGVNKVRSNLISNLLKIDFLANFLALY